LILPSRQLAVLVHRDALGFHTNEVPDMLDCGVESVKTALPTGRSDRRAQPSQAGSGLSVGAFDRAEHPLADSLDIVLDGLDRRWSTCGAVNMHDADFGRGQSGLRFDVPGDGNP
jgi:hypothetical protein